MRAIIMAGGRGTRLMPLTKNLPKPMIKLIDKPVLEYILTLLKSHGITEAAMTLGYMSEAIENYFGDGKKFGVNLTYFVENKPLGTAGGVKNARSFVKGDFLVISGDCYAETDLAKAAEFHSLAGSPFTLIARPEENPKGLGVLEADINHRLKSFVEKPDEPRPALINTGTYIMNESVLDMIPDGFYDFGRQLLPRLVGKAAVYVDYGYWSDIGTLTSYYRTNGRLAEILEKQTAEARVSI